MRSSSPNSQRLLPQHHFNHLIHITVHRSTLPPLDRLVPRSPASENRDRLVPIHSLVRSLVTPSSCTECAHMDPTVGTLTLPSSSETNALRACQDGSWALRPPSAISMSSAVPFPLSPIRMIPSGTPSLREPKSTYISMTSPSTPTIRIYPDASVVAHTCHETSYTKLYNIGTLPC